MNQANVQLDRESQRGAWGFCMSLELRDIWEHISEGERNQLTKFSETHERRQRWVWCFSILLPALGVFTYTLSPRFAVLLFCIWPVYLFLDPVDRAFRKRLRKMLCATVYARTHGYQPHSLKLIRVPWFQ